jgi:uncharacterized membrane protein YeiB
MEATRDKQGSNHSLLFLFTLFVKREFLHMFFFLFCVGFSLLILICMSNQKQIETN